MWHVIAVLALTMLCVLGACSAPDANSTPGHKAASPPLRVMGFNIRYATAADGENRWERRRDLVINTIRGFDPDVLGVQECLASQAAFLRKQMSGYDLVGVGRDDGGARGEMAAMLFRRDRFLRLDHGHFWLSETPDEPGSVGWDASLTRMCTWVRLRDDWNAGRELFCFNTHFDHAGVMARHESAKLLSTMIADIARDTTVVVIGDFNAPADPRSNGPYVALTNPRRSGSALVDTYRAASPEITESDGTFNAFRGVDTGPRIDWILVSSDLAVIEAGIDRSHAAGRYPSDHFPVIAIVRWSRPQEREDR
jgi:endonuclease/exonuclease/phosphatase family metal-dependent hydrolase